jgi:hypothetical protein
MLAESQLNDTEGVLTGKGRGQFHKIDPRTGREPAGSSLLARGSAIRQAQEAALRQAIAKLAAQGKPGWSGGDGERLDEFIERTLVPRTSDFIERRWVIDESRDDRFYFVTLNVVFDTPALSEALKKFGG